MDEQQHKLWLEMSIREISTQAHFADTAYRNIQSKAPMNTDLVFTSIHSFLSHAAMVSKMLKSKDPLDPSIDINSILGIDEGSIIHNRDFRDHLEHYYERLKKWVVEYPRANIGTYNIGPKEAFGVPNMLFVSHYDPVKNIYTFVNEEIDLSLLYEEVIKILEISNRWVNELNRSIF